MCFIIMCVTHLTHKKNTIVLFKNLEHMNKLRFKV